MSWVEDQWWFGLEDCILTQRQYELDLSKWRCANGKIVSIFKINTNHLKNCIAKIKRENWRLEYLPILEEELYNRQYNETKSKNPCSCNM